MKVYIAYLVSPSKCSTWHFTIDLQRTLRLARQTTIIGARELDNPCDLDTKGF